MTRLTRRDWQIINEVLGFVLAGEWPETGDEDADSDMRARAESVKAKVEDRIERDKSPATSSGPNER